MRALGVALIALIAACRDGSPPPRATLAQYLGTLAGADAATRAREVAGWQLDRATWDRTVAGPYTAVHDDYTRGFTAAAPRLVAQLATRRAVTTRPHFAGDPRLSLGQAQARWALPVQYPSEIAELDGSPLDVVFVPDGERWRAITGIDDVLRARAAAITPACAGHLGVTSSKQCRDVGWVIADAALRSDRARFAHACSLAASLCAK